MYYEAAQNYNLGNVNLGYAQPAQGVPAYEYPPVYAAPQPAPVHVLTPDMHYQTESLLAKATELASAILGQVDLYVVQNHPAPVFQPQYVPQPAAPIIPVHLHLGGSRDRGFRMFNNETHIHHHYNNPAQDQEKSDTNTRLLVGGLGLIAAFVTIFFVGKAEAEKEELDDTVAQYEKLKGQWQINKMCYDYRAQEFIDNIVENTDRILDRKQTNKAHKIALLWLGFGSGGVAFVGAVLAIKALMAAAVIGGAAVGAVAIYKLGYACFSGREAKEAAAINMDIRSLRVHQQFAYVQAF